MRAEFKPKRTLHTALDHTYTGDRGRNVTTRAHYYRDPVTQMTVTVPRGFRTDFASFPRVLWWLFDPQGPWARAALYHDWLYRTQALSREQADMIFRWIMLADGVPACYRAIFFTVLRLWGKVAWNRNAELLTASGGTIDLQPELDLLADDIEFGHAQEAI